MQNASRDKCTPAHPCRIVCADDDEDDRALLRLAFEATRWEGALDFVEDGRELLQYLRREGPYQLRPQAGCLPLVLLDLNMPGKDGSSVLRELKRDQDLRDVPVVVLTSQTDPKVVRLTYELGCNSFVVKPASFAALVTMIDTIISYWFELSLMPAPDEKQTQ